MLSVSLFPLNGVPDWMPKGKSPWKPICVFIGKEKRWLDQGDVIMNSLFSELNVNEGRGKSYHIGPVMFRLRGSLIALTSDSIPLVYLVGSKGGSGKTRAAMEYISTSDEYSTRFRQHEVIIHEQIEFHWRWLDQKNGAFGKKAKDQPQTRNPTCSASFDTFGELAKMVTTPGGGGFHSISHLLETLIRAILRLIKDQKQRNRIRHVLDVRQSLVAAGEMTNSVQMLINKFSGCALAFVLFHDHINLCWPLDWLKSCLRC